MSVHRHTGDGLPPKLPTSRRVTVALVVVAAVGVAFLVIGTVKNYGPCYLMGGIWLGFALGVHLARQTIKRTLEDAMRLSSDRSSTTRR